MSILRMFSGSRTQEAQEQQIESSSNSTRRFFTGSRKFFVSLDIILGAILFLIAIAVMVSTNILSIISFAIESVFSLPILNNVYEAFRFVFGTSAGFMVLFLIFIIITTIILKLVKLNDLSKGFLKYTVIFYIIIALILGLMNFYTANPMQVDENEENTGNRLESLWISIKCAFDINLVDEECQERLGETVSEVVAEQRISIVANSLINQQIFELRNEQESLPFTFSINTPVRLHALRYECYSSLEGGRDTPFYSADIDRVVIKQEVIAVECRNIHEIMQENNQQIQISANLVYSVEQKFTQEIPVINCNNEQVISRSGGQSTNNCRFLSWNNVRELDRNLHNFNPRAVGGNSIMLDTQGFDNNLPIRIGDGEERQLFLQLIVQKRDEVVSLGDLIEAEIVSIDLPFVLAFSSEVDQNLFTEPIKSGEDGRARALVRLKENEAVQLDDRAVGLITTMDINTRAILTRRAMTQTAIRFIADFHFPEEEAQTQSQINAGERTVEEDGTIVVRDPNDQNNEQTNEEENNNENPTS